MPLAFLMHKWLAPRFFALTTLNSIGIVGCLGMLQAHCEEKAYLSTRPKNLTHFAAQYAVSIQRRHQDLSGCF